MTRIIDVVEVPRALLMRYAGQPWDRVCAANGVDGVTLRQVPHGDKSAPLDTAWLREIDGRAFLYIQNWIAADAFVYLQD